MQKSNIKFEYLYRDYGNYKVFGNVVFSNPKRLTIASIRKSLEKFEFFNPLYLKIPALHHSDFQYDSSLDHAFNEYSTVEETNEPPTDNRSIEEFLSIILNLKECCDET